ncbi:MAG: DNA polymerase II small subunit, partial [Archaeoglobaceae archaeon]
MNEGGQRVVKNIDPVTVAKKLLVRGHNISPEAAQLICSSEDPEAIIEEVCKIAKNKFIISEEDVRAILTQPKTIKSPETKKQAEFKTDQGIRILRDFRTSIVEGKVEDFVAYFNSR